MDWSSYTTRKVVLGAGAVLIIAGAWVATQWIPIAGEHYGTMVAGLTGLYATFCGANVVQDHILKNSSALTAKGPKGGSKVVVEEVEEE